MDLSFETLGLEAVTTPGGTFDAVGIQASGTIESSWDRNPIREDAEISAQYWYSPEVAALVKGEATWSLESDGRAATYKERIVLQDFQRETAADEPAPIKELAPPWQRIDVAADHAFPLDANNGPVTVMFGLAPVPDAFEEEQFWESDYTPVATQTFPDLAPLEIEWTLRAATNDGTVLGTSVGSMFHYTFDEPVGGVIEARPFYAAAPCDGSDPPPTQEADITATWHAEAPLDVAPGPPQTYKVMDFNVHAGALDVGVAWESDPGMAFGEDLGEWYLRDPGGSDWDTEVGWPNEGGPPWAGHVAAALAGVRQRRGPHQRDSHRLGR